MAVEELLASDEHILIDGRQHPVALIKFALQPILILGLAAVMFAIGTWFNPDGILTFIDTLLGLATLLVFLVGIVWLPIQAFRWTTRHYVLTNRRTIRIDGVLRVNSSDHALGMINDVQFSQGVLGRKLGYGDLNIATASGDTNDDYPMLRDALAFKIAMMDAKQAVLDQGIERVAAGVRTAAPEPAAGAPATAPAAVGSEDVTATLASLADLRDRGAITAAEYDEKKAELLARL